VGPDPPPGTRPQDYLRRLRLRLAPIARGSCDHSRAETGYRPSRALDHLVARCLRDLPHDQAFAAYETLRRPRVERVIKETTRKNSSKTAGPAGRVLFALAMRIFTKLAKPEKMAWMFDYRIDWNAPVTPAALQTA